MPVTLGEKSEDGIKYEYLKFSGRDTGMGRVSIYGVFAAKEKSPSRNAILILPDSDKTVDEKVLKYFVNNGYSALMVDYRGKTEGCERYTEYPDNVRYANFAECGRHKDYVDESADKTSWYEWVAVGIYARKLIIKKLNTPNVGVIGIREGGEIAWKLITAAQFSCAVTVCAGGWKAYSGYAKYGSEEPELDEERYRFIAGIDSQAYAPYVKCPVLMLCSTNDPQFDYDRAYDTFSRINPAQAEYSAICYAVRNNGCIGEKSIMDMNMFLDSFVKQRHVFLPKPAEINITVDEEDNLIAKAYFDEQGIIDKYGVYMAEDSIDPSLRDWVKAPFKKKISNKECEFYLNVYEKTSMLFALCYVTYSNGFTVWSRITVKKISGKFRNSQPKCKVMYSSTYGYDCFSVYDYSDHSIGDVFFNDYEYMPAVVTKGKKKLKGIYSECGLATYRSNNPHYAPDKDSILKLDVCPDDDMTLILSMKIVKSGETYTTTANIVGGVWQSLVLPSKLFKNGNGVALSDFTDGLQFSISGKGTYAINNVLWL